MGTTYLKIRSGKHENGVPQGKFTDTLIQVERSEKGQLIYHKVEEAVLSQKVLLEAKSSL
jgi:hypothetical protein